MRDAVLLVTRHDDHFTVDRVAAALAARGARPYRVDGDRFPSQLQLSSRFDGGAFHHQLRLPGGVTVRDDEVQAVWLRRLAPPLLDPELAPEFRDGCAREAVAALAGFLDGLHEARWIDPWPAIEAAENKLRQLRLAHHHGLPIPPTLVTNDPEAVRAFYADHGGEVVAKLLTPFSTSMDGASPFVHTSRVEAGDLDDLDGLAHAPMVFQGLVPKARELRVILVDGRGFVGAIDARGSARGQIDWRLARPEESSWSVGSLPEAVAARLGAVVQDLGLRYGAADLIVTPEGEHVFLEVNPMGEWGMLERDLELPISAALADALLAPAA